MKANSKGVVASRIVDNNSNYSSNNFNKLTKEKGSAKKMSSAVIAPMSNYHQHHSLLQHPMHGNISRGDLYHHQQQQPYSMWHAKSYSHESGIGEFFF